MKFAILALLLATTCFGLAGKVFRPTLANPMTTSYALTKVQLASELGASKNILINNTASSNIACDINHRTAASVPVDVGLVTSEAVVIPASTAVVLDNVYPKEQIFCRSDSGSNITSGAIYLQVW